MLWKWARLDFDLTIWYWAWTLLNPISTYFLCEFILLCGEGRVFTPELTCGWTDHDQTMLGSRIFLPTCIIGRGLQGNPGIDPEGSKVWPLSLLCCSWADQRHAHLCAGGNCTRALSVMQAATQGADCLQPGRSGRHRAHQCSCYPDLALGSVDLWCCIS